VPFIITDGWFYEKAGILFYYFEAFLQFELGFGFLEVFMCCVQELLERV
jgi:hypothetical protein